MIGCVPLQVPGLAVRICPSWAWPLIVGREVFAGAVADAVTTAVAAEVALALPAAFVAVTLTRIVDPTSALVKMYFGAVAPEMTLQALPLVLHRCHSRAKLVGLRVQPPTVEVKVCPCTVVPVIVGGEVLMGGPVAASAEGSAPASTIAPIDAAAAKPTLFRVSVTFPPSMQRALVRCN